MRDSFDEQSSMLIMTSRDGLTPVATAEQALTAYLTVVEQLLRSVGAAHIGKAKAGIARALGLDELSIQLDLQAVTPGLLDIPGDRMPLEAIEGADEFAGELEARAEAILHFSYPHPEPEPGGGGLRP